jgi:20S proteasome subunit alpha 1
MIIATILMGIDDEKGPQIFKIDPAGRCEGFRGCTAGQKDQEAMTLLEKAYKKKAQTGGTFNLEEATETVIETLQNVIGADFKAPDIEVAILTKADPTFKLLQPADIERNLNRIADKS